jgi:hypothetical protein
MDLTRFTAIIAECQFDSWRFIVAADGERAYLQVEADGPCAVSGETLTWRGRKWWLSPHMTKSEIVQTAFKAVLTAVEHEARESFRYRGQAIFGPHFDVDQLVRLCAEHATDERKGAAA